MQFGTVRLSVSVRGDVPYQAYIPVACLVAVLILKRGGDLFSRILQRSSVGIVMPRGRRCLRRNRASPSLDST